jgi:hypothetical protein
MNLEEIMNPEKNSNPSEVEQLQALVNFALEPEKEITSMTREEIQQYLADKQISTEPSREDIKEQFEAAKNRLRLRAAREKRLETGQSRPRENWAQDYTQQLSGQTLRNEVIRRLNALQGGKAAAYFRNLEESDDEDLRTMLRDLDRLAQRDEE